MTPHTSSVEILYNQTVMSPIALVFLLAMIVLIVLLKDEKVIIPVIFSACYITSQQKLSLGGLDLNITRILIFILYLRMIIKKEWIIKKLNSIDKAVITFFIFNIILHTLLWGNTTALINRIGYAYTLLGIYFVIRNYIHTFKGINTIIEWLIIASILVSIAMMMEQFTGRNPFGFLGGVPELTKIRRGKLRSQGAFSHAIMAGSFGASLLALVWGYSRHPNRRKILVVIGYCTSVIITITSNSSGPLFGMIAGISAIFLWNLKDYLPMIRKVTLTMIIGLEILMEKHIWHLISRISIRGSTGHHRFRLIEAAIDNFGDWFLLGTTATYLWGPNLHDITNHYILEGVRGGILNLILFIVVLYQCYKSIGMNIKELKDINLQKYAWAFGVMLFVHNISFIAVSYFGQMLFFYYFYLGVISSLRDTTINKLASNDNPAIT